MEGHAKKCVERSRPSIYRRRNGICWRIVKTLLTNYSKMPVCGTHWKTRHSMVCEQTCTCCHQMDQSLWQTFSTFDLLHTPHEWIRTILSCGKHCTTMQIRTVSGLWFCRRPIRFKINIRWILVHIWKWYIRTKSWMCKKQTSVSHSSTDAEILSLDAGLRTDGIPALDLWDLVFEVFHSSPNQTKESKGRVQRNLLRDTPSNKHTHNRTKTPNQHDSLEMSNLDFVSSNAKSSQVGAMLYIFEDNEAVIKIIIKGRSSTMWHVSRTHRVALDWLSDRINLDPKISIKYVDTKHQLADMLAKDFTRDEWNNLLHLFNISHFSSICCSQNFSSTSFPETMAKRMQEEKGEERIVAKSKPTLNLVSHAATSSSTVQSPIASKSPGILRAPCQPHWKSAGRLVAREPNQDAASSSQGWQKDAETRRDRKLRHLRYWHSMATQSPYIYIYCLRSTSWRSFLDCETEIRSQT